MIDSHQIGIDAFQASVDDHHRRAHTRQTLRQATVSTGRGDDQAVDAFFQQYAQVAALLLRVVVGVAEDHAVTIALTVILDAPRQFGEIRVETVGHQQTNGRRSFGLE
ncbi:hypothetical protein D3C81_1707970 [compost metagenome]